LDAPKDVLELVDGVGSEVAPEDSRKLGRVYAGTLASGIECGSPESLVDLDNNARFGRVLIGSREPKVSEDVSRTTHNPSHLKTSPANQLQFLKEHPLAKALALLRLKLFWRGRRGSWLHLAPLEDFREGVGFVPLDLLPFGR
jgi:hypothetical protein